MAKFDRNPKAGKPDLELLVVCLAHKRIVGRPGDRGLACSVCNAPAALLHERTFEVQQDVDRAARVSFMRETREAFRWEPDVSATP